MRVSAPPTGVHDPAEALTLLPGGTPAIREARGVGVLGGDGEESARGKGAPGACGRSAGDAVDPRFKNELTRDAAPVDAQPPAGVIWARGVHAPATACALSPAGASAVSGVSLPRLLSSERVLTPGDRWASGGRRPWHCTDTAAVGVFVSKDTVVAEAVVATWAGVAEPFPDGVVEAVVRGGCIVCWQARTVVEQKRDCTGIESKGQLQREECTKASQIGPHGKSCGWGRVHARGFAERTNRGNRTYFSVAGQRIV